MRASAASGAGMLPVPVLTPRLSSLWLGLVTPLYARVGRKLIDSIRNRDRRARRPARGRLRGPAASGSREAIARALRNEDRGVRGDALVGRAVGGGDRRASGAGFASAAASSIRASVRVAAPPAAAFAPIRRIGGATGWYYANWLWRLRGFLDLLAGGVGMRRGRADPEHLPSATRSTSGASRRSSRTAGSASPPRCGSRAGPGSSSRSRRAAGSTIRQTAVFDPVGLGGLAYWYLVWPLHQMVFAGMLRNLAAAAEAGATTLPAAASGAA